jgi:hypothetical protein
MNIDKTLSEMLGTILDEGEVVTGTDTHCIQVIPRKFVLEYGCGVDRMYAYACRFAACSSLSAFGVYRLSTMTYIRACTCWSCKPESDHVLPYPSHIVLCIDKNGSATRRTICEQDLLQLLIDLNTHS